MSVSVLYWGSMLICSKLKCSGLADVIMTDAEEAPAGLFDDLVGGAEAMTTEGKRIMYRCRRETP